MSEPCAIRDELIVELLLAAQHPSPGDDKTADFELDQSTLRKIRQLLVEHCMVHGC
ncbi:MAG TPA: hypothetical protein VN736_10640 [Candidatus Limnocylindrales bacterium]|nr:hypothetical protein [Candidatus Limnocylindrales bacterium]